MPQTTTTTNTIATYRPYSGILGLPEQVHHLQHGWVAVDPQDEFGLLRGGENSCVKNVNCHMKFIARPNTENTRRMHNTS